MSQKLTITLIVIVLAVVLAVGVAIGVVAIKRSHSPNAYWEKRVSRFVRENKTATKGGIVFLGDSITDMCDLAKYYPSLAAYNRGIGGDITAGVLNRMDSSVYDLEPSLVVLLIGVNDTSLNVPTSEILANYEKIVSDIRDNCPNAKIICQSVYPVNDRAIKELGGRAPVLKELNFGIKNICEERGLTYVDLWETLSNPGDDLLRLGYSEDGLHPNDAGYRAISAVLSPVIANVLAE